MSLSSLPPELLLQIIESSVPRDFHSTTYSDRQLTLCALSLVSKSFGAIAQPLLLDFVFIQSSPLLNNVLDQLARQSSIRVPRIFVIFLCRSETEPVAVKRLPELVPSLPALALNLEKSVAADSAFEPFPTDLTTLHLSSPNFSLPPSIVLPALKALSLCDVGLNLILDLLSPSNLPSLQALALLYGSDDEADALQTTNISGLTEQLESLYLRIDTWKDVEPQKRLLLTKRTLVDCSYWELETAAQDALVVTNLRIFGVGDAAVAQAGQYYNSAVLPQNRNNRSSHQLSLQTTHPAAFATDPEAEYSPLEAPALPFSSSGSRRRSRSRSGDKIGSNLQTRPTSSSSLPSLAITSSPSLSALTPSSDSTDSLPSTSSRRDMHGRGLSDAQEELLVEAQNDSENGKDYNPYAWERPLDSVNRHSRMLDSSPLATASDPSGRRVSRLPPGVQMLDPFGFSLAADASPYDLALNASSPSATPGVLSPSRSPVRSSFLQPQLTSASTSTSSHGHSQFPSSSSIASNLSNASTAATTPTLQPWTKPRAASAGEVYQLNSRAQIKSGLLGPPPVSRGTSSRSRLSKLSGEIEAETASIASTTSKQQLPAFVPADSDYLNSKLYARTLKAQKALEKERFKAASKGKMSRYDSEAAKSTSSLAVPRSSMDTGRPASIMSVASMGKIRSGRRSALGWFKSSSEIALSPPTPDPPAESPPLPTSRSSTALPISSRPLPTAFQSHPPNLAPEPVLRSANSSSDYLREARESVAAQKAPTMTSRQASGGSNSSNGSTGGGAGEELVRPSPIPVRKSRASPSGSFQHSPTIRESSPPSTPVDETPQDPLPPPVTSLPDRQIPVSPPPRPSRHSSLDAHTRPSSTTPTPIADPVPEPQTASSSVSHSAIPHRISSSTLKPSTPPPLPLHESASQAAPRHSQTRVASGPPPTAPPIDSLPPPRPPHQPEPIRPLQTSQTPFPSSSPSRPLRDPNYHREAPTSPSKSSSPTKSARTNGGSVVPPPLLTPDASLANGAEVGVKRRKSSLGLLFGGGGGSNRNGKNASPSTTTAATQPGGTREKERISRRTDERSKMETKPVVKEKMKEKVKESFFGRVKRPEIPEQKPAPIAATPRSRPALAGITSSPPPATFASSQPLPPSRLPPSAQPPVPQYSPLPSSSPNLPTNKNGKPETSARAPDSSSSASTEFSTLSSSSSTLPPTPSSGRSSNGLSKSVNGATSKANGGGGSAFSNFFSRHRTKSLGPTASSTPQKLSRSKNSTPTPEDDRRQMPVLPSKGNFVDRMTPLKKSSRNGTPQSFPGVENYAPPSNNNPNELMVSSNRSYPAYA
ncbi:hypothetical protein JCM3765_005041 [Sporobolomyces pararoseus]